jgi:isopentenyldiphosphate isomerase
MVHMDEPEEQLDLVDENDHVIGVIRREGIAKLLRGEPVNGQRGFVRGTGILLINSKGELWIPRRQPHKKIAPNGLDLSMAEHVGAGETYLHAAIRGLAEELNMTGVEEHELMDAGIIRPFGNIPYFHAVYVYRTDVEPGYNRDDFVSAEWVTPDRLRERLMAGEPAKEVLLPAIECAMKMMKG